MSKTLDEMRSNAEISALVEFGRLPKRETSNKIEAELYNLMYRRKRVYRFKKENAFYQSDIEILKEGGMWDLVQNYLQPENQTTKLQNTIDYLNNLPINDFDFHRSSVFVSHLNWLRYQQKRKSKVPGIEKLCNAAGYPGLLSGMKYNHELRNYVNCVQFVKWHKINNRMPNPLSKDPIERHFAGIIANKHQFLAASIEYLSSHKINLNMTDSNPVLDFNSLKQELENLKQQVSLLTAAIGKQQKTPKKHKNLEWFKKDWVSQTVCPENELIGMMQYRTNAGKEIIVGVENYLKYASGNMKLVCRVLNYKNEYRKIIYLWSSSKNIIHLEFFHEKKTI